tara:strand:+ start:134 stop:526 length:393 start_codon:yes stop_codon:yes gene_type:complete
MNFLKKSYNAFKKTCTPAQLYFILGLIAIIASLQMKYQLNMTIFNIILLILWTFLLNMFCNWGWSSLSWFLVLFPYILLLLAIFLPLVITKEVKEKKEEKKNSKNNIPTSIQDNLVRTHRMIHEYDKMNL